MKLAHPFLSKPVEWEEGYVTSIIVEAPAFLYNFTTELIRQEAGDDGNFVLSHNNDILRIDKNLEIITDVFRMDFANKKIFAGLQKELAEIGRNKYDAVLCQIYSDLQKLFEDMEQDLPYAIEYETICTPEPIIKLMNARPEQDADSLAEKLITYMELSKHYTGKNVFVILNMKAFLTKEQFQLLCKDIVYRKICVLFMDGVDLYSVGQEKKLIIDSDLCEIE